jgi:uncharacterized membrane protein YdfJ with MMPL/SSD domain
MHPAKRNLAARAGHWSARHRKPAIFGWLAFVLVALVVGSAVGVRSMTDADQDVGESGRGDAIARKAFPKAEGESVLVQSRKPGVTATDPQFRAVLRDVGSTLKRQQDVDQVKVPGVSSDAPVSRDGRSALVSYRLKGDEDATAKAVKPVLAAVAAKQRANPGFRIEEFGGASASTAIDDRVAKDFKKAELLSIPVTLVILVIAFGAIVAAGIPVLLALSAVAAAIGLVAIPSQLIPMDDSVTSVILLIGMAVGIDYSLFYVRREREERAKGASAEGALEIAAATSGRAVLVSGLTVLIAMAGMFLTGNLTFMGFAVATMLVVAIAMIGSVTVLPAMLAWLGDRVDKGRLPFLGRRRRADGTSRLWNAVLDRVLRHPVVAAIGATAVLVALAIPAFGLHPANTGTEGLPQDLAAVKTYNRIQKAFPGNELPATVVVKARDVTSPAVRDGISRLEREAAATGRFGGAPTVDVSPDKTVATVDLPVPGKGTDARSEAAIDVLRTDVVPTTVGRVAGVETAVTGYTAGSKDFTDQMTSTAPLVFAFVLGLAFLLLLVTFRSIVIPLKAIVLNLLSVAAAYGVLVLVFQEGWGESLLGFKSTGTVTAWLPMFLFVILFGLSMDYHVFILSRIKEAFDRGESTDDAVAHGIKSTAGVVTSAAIVMVAVFSIFATLSLIDMKEMGVGLAAAVLIDATIVRAVLLPATMKLLGKWNWYLPQSLEWLPRVSHEPRIEPARA